MKERLRRIDPTLVWQNVSRHPSRRAKTITSATAIDRLKSAGNIHFKAEDEESLKLLRETRNDIEHHEWRASENEAKLIIGNALSFAFAFAQDELGIDLSDDFKHDDTWRMFLNELYAFVRSHGARLEEKLRAKGEFPACCDQCGELTVPSRGGSCELCGHWQANEQD